MKKNKLPYIAIRYFISTLLLVMFMAALPVYAADLGDVKTLLRAKQAIKENPDSVRSHREYQNAMINDGWYDAMITEYSERLKNNGESPENIYLRERLNDNIEANAVVFEELIDNFPSFTWGYYGLANVLAQRGDKDGAMKLYEFILDIDPSHVEAYKEIALFYEKQGDYVKADEAILKSLKYIPDNPQLLAMHATFLRKSGQYEEALSFVNKALGLEPDHELALRQLGFICSNMRKYEEAVMARRHYLSLWPNSFPEAWYLLCTDLFELYDNSKDVGILNEAEQTCFESVKRFEGDVNILIFYINLFNKRGWVVHELLFNQRAFKVLPTDHKTYSEINKNIGLIPANRIAGYSFPNEVAIPKDYLYTFGDLSESGRTAFGIDESSRKWQQLESMMGKQSEVSSETLNLVVEALPNFAPAYYNRGIAQLNNRNLDEGLSDLKHSTVLEPKWARAHAALAVGYILKREYSNARKSLKDADTTGAESPAFEYNKSFMRVFDEAVVDGTVEQLQAIAEAIKGGGGPRLGTFFMGAAFERYFDRDPTSPEIYEAYGDIYFADSNDYYWRTALDNYKKALELGGEKKRLTDKITKIEKQIE